MRLLDLFCGGGGAGVGYARAGFDVVGVDIARMPAYPYEFHREDALAFLSRYGNDFDVIHASPPCQGYSSAVDQTDSKYVYYSRGKAEPRLIGPVREIMLQLGKPYIIENVEGARPAMRAPILLCGSMFEAHPQRHRLFETNWPLRRKFHPNCEGWWDKRFARDLGIDWRDMSVTGKSRRSGSIDTWKELMGMDWPNLRGSDLVEAIPPRYTEYIGRQLLELWPVQVAPPPEQGVLI